MSTTATPDPPSTTNPDPLLTQAQACDYLQIGRTTLAREQAAGRLHPIRVRRSVRYRRSELERYLREASS